MNPFKMLFAAVIVGRSNRDQLSSVTEAFGRQIWWSRVEVEDSRRFWGSFKGILRTNEEFLRMTDGFLRMIKGLLRTIAVFLRMTDGFLWMIKGLLRTIVGFLMKIGGFLMMIGGFLMMVEGFLMIIYYLMILWWFLSKTYWASLICRQLKVERRLLNKMFGSLKNVMCYFSVKLTQEFCT